MYEELIEPVLFMGDGKEAHNATIMLGNGDRPTTRDLGGYARGKVRFGCNGMRQPKKWPREEPAAQRGRSKRSS